MIMVITACGAGDNLPVNQPVETLTFPFSVIPRQVHTPIAAPHFLLSTPQPLSSPVWVTEFSDPILTAVKSQRPVFEDHFFAICIDGYKNWKVCSTPEQRTYYQHNTYDESSISELPLATARPTLDLQPDLQNGYTLLNKGWFYFIPGNPRGPFYAHIQDEALLIKLPAENENRDYWVYNPKLTRKDFVLSFDLQFEESQPEDTVRFQFDQTTDQSVALDLSKNQTWILHWGSRLDWQSATGSYDNFPPERITVLVIAQGKKCAVYLNNAPLTYMDTCRTEPIARPSPWAFTFHMLAEPGHIAAATIDNVKLWDLDKVTGISPPP